MPAATLERSTYAGMHAANGGAITDSDHLQQSINDIVLTAIGTRVQRRNYGSIVPMLIDQPSNAITLMRTQSAIVQALLLWEPRIVIEQVLISKPQLDGKQSIEVVGKHKRNGKPVAASVQLKEAVQ